MQKRKTNTECNDAPIGAIVRLTEDAVVTDGESAGSNKGEEYRVTPPLSWKTIPTGFLTVSDVERLDVVLEDGKGEVRV